MDCIFINDIAFVGHHGVSKRERDEGTSMRADIAVYIDSRRAAKSDRLAQTVNHETLAKIAHDLGGQASYKLMETLAQRIVDEVFAQTSAASVEVRVRKIFPSLPGMPSSSGVSIARDRNGEMRPLQALQP